MSSSIARTASLITITNPIQRSTLTSQRAVHTKDCAPHCAADASKRHVGKKQPEVRLPDGAPQPRTASGTASSAIHTPTTTPPTPCIPHVPHSKIALVGATLTRRQWLHDLRADTGLHVSPPTTSIATSLAVSGPLNRATAPLPTRHDAAPYALPPRHHRRLAFAPRYLSLDFWIATAAGDACTARTQSP